MVSLANAAMFQGSENLPGADKVAILRIYELALIIPLLSVSGVLLGGFLKRREISAARGARAQPLRDRPPAPDPEEKTAPNWWILGGSAVFVALTIGIGLSGFNYARRSSSPPRSQSSASQISRLLRELSPRPRAPCSAR